MSLIGYNVALHDCMVHVYTALVDEGHRSFTLVLNEHEISYYWGYKLILVQFTAVTSKQSHKLARITIATLTCAALWVIIVFLVKVANVK